MADESEIRRLVGEVYRYGECDNRGRKAITKIAEIGEQAIPIVRSVMQTPPESELHPRDLADSIQAIFNEMARTAPDALIDLMKQDSDAEFAVVWALGNAKGDRCLAALVAALSHKNKWIRWAAAESLVRYESKTAVDPLLDALCDRSSMVKSTVVIAMAKDSMYRKRRALDSLRRIVANHAIRKNSPGLWKEAQQVIDTIEQECPDSTA